MTRPSSACHPTSTSPRALGHRDPHDPTPALQQPSQPDHQPPHEVEGRASPGRSGVHTGIHQGGQGGTRRAGRSWQKGQTQDSRASSARAPGSADGQLQLLGHRTDGRLRRRNAWVSPAPRAAWAVGNISGQVSTSLSPWFKAIWVTNKSSWGPLPQSTVEGTPTFPAGTPILFYYLCVQKDI